MLSEKIQSALNEQINFELFSAYLYFSMAAWLESEDLPGHANWMKVQAMEEMLHVDKLYGYIIERDGRVLAKAIEAPQNNWETPLAAFKNAYEHELEVSARINKLVDLSLQESDHATNSFLQWFVNEQVEEESSVKAVVQQLRLIGEDGHGLFMVDRELGQRVFLPPQTTAN